MPGLFSLIRTIKHRACQQLTRKIMTYEYNDTMLKYFLFFIQSLMIKAKTYLTKKEKYVITY